jgi:hypothetical protein
VEATPCTQTMSRKKTLFGIGMALYAVSFALVAVADRHPSSGSLRGYAAAIFSIWAVLSENPLSDHWLFQGKEFAYVSLLVSSLINPLFLVTLTMAARGYQQTVAILKVILLLMIPFCLIGFGFQTSYPREGFFLWVSGMVLALFSGFLQSESIRDWEECPWCSGKDQNCPRCGGTGWILVRDQPKLRQEVQAKRSSNNR